MSTKKKSTKKTKSIRLRKLQSHDTLWHPDSRLVFKSKTEKLVVGRLTDDDNVVLDEEALGLCETWSFKIDPALVESESDNDEEEVLKTKKSNSSASTENDINVNTRESGIASTSCASNPMDHVDHHLDMHAEAASMVKRHVDESLALIRKLSTQLQQEKEKREVAEKKLHQIKVLF
jgi:hypothetical protein